MYEYKNDPNPEHASINRLMRYKEITRQQLQEGYFVLSGNPWLGIPVRGERREFTVLRRTPAGNYIVVDPEFEAEQERARLREEGLIP